MWKLVLIFAEQAALKEQRNVEKLAMLFAKGTFEKEVFGRRALTSSLLQSKPGGQVTDHHFLLPY